MITRVSRFANRQRSTGDALSLLTLYLCVLVAIPAQLIIKPIGAPGNPAGLVAVLAIMWWAFGRMIPNPGTAWGFQPIRLAVGLFALSILAAYVVAAGSGLPEDQLSAADRGLIALAGWVGISSVAADMLSSIDSVTRLLRRMTVAGALLGLVGIVQFAVGIDLASYVRIPGLVPNNELAFIGERADFRRVAGTASHPIEFGVVMAVLLPIALHFAVTDKERPTWLRWGVVAVIGGALPMSLSRSAILAALVGLLTLFVGWNGIRRFALLVGAAVSAVVFRFAVPGLLGTIRSLFSNLASDPSIQGRTDDYLVVGGFIDQSPMFGRGFGTFLPSTFFFVDNQYLGSIIETGYTGLVCLILVFVVGLACARGIRLRSASDQVRDLATALFASVLAIGLAFVTFDGLGFPMVTGFLFLILGCVGALWRLTGGVPMLPIQHPYSTSDLAAHRF